MPEGTPISYHGARTPGVPMRLHRLRWADAPAGGDGAAVPADGAGAAGAPAAPVAPTPQAPAAPAAPVAGDGLPDDPAALKALIASLRKENASDRTNAKQTAADEARNALVQDLGKALGLVKDGKEAPTAEQLTAQVTAAQTQAREAAVQLAVYRAAATHQGDPAALLDSRAFLAKVTDLDPADAEFDKKVGDAIKEAVAANTKLRAVQVAGSSAVDHAGGSGEGGTTKSLEQAVTAALTK